MCTLNKVGQLIAEVDGVTALTDVTGFGLAGHLIEICQGSDLQAKIDFDAIPLLDNVDKFIELGSIPGGTTRNYDSIKHLIELTPRQQNILCDPQTSGGLLISVSKEAEITLQKLLAEQGIKPIAIGELIPVQKNTTMIQL